MTFDEMTKLAEYPEFRAAIDKHLKDNSQRMSDTIRDCCGSVEALLSKLNINYFTLFKWLYNLKTGEGQFSLPPDIMANLCESELKTSVHEFIFGEKRSIMLPIYANTLLTNYRKMKSSDKKAFKKTLKSAALKQGYGKPYHSTAEFRKLFERRVLVAHQDFGSTDPTKNSPFLVITPNGNLTSYKRSKNFVPQFILFYSVRYGISASYFTEKDYTKFSMVLDRWERPVTDGDDLELIGMFESLDDEERANLGAQLLAETMLM